MRGRRGGTLAAALLVASCSGGSNPPTSSSSSDGPGRRVSNEGWVHVAEESVVNYVSNPPASGPHYPVWARYEAYSTPLSRPYWVHNLEHGAIVFLYRPDAPAATIAALLDAYRGLPADPECSGQPRALVTPDPLLPQPFAVVAADWILDGAATVDATPIRAFVQAHRNHAPENICAGGDRP